MIVNDIPIEKMVELRLKCIICDKVSGKKVGWGYEKEWLGNALQERPNPSQSQFAAAVSIFIDQVLSEIHTVSYICVHVCSWETFRL